jgi:hypothetical protein
MAGENQSGRVPSEPGCEPTASTACGVLAESHPSRDRFRLNIRWGHLDRMPKCAHGRVICVSCGLPA